MKDKKILVINGSPHKDRSFTMNVTDAFVRGLSAGGEYESETVHVSDLNITPCMGCLSCWGRTEGECVIKNDDAQKVQGKIEASDIVILSFPIYLFGLPGPLKTLMDRLLNMLNAYKGQQPPQNGEPFHTARRPRPGQKLVLISSCAYTQTDEIYEPIVGQFERLCGKGAFETIFCPQLQTLIAYDRQSKRTERYLKKFEDAGVEFAGEGKFSPETKARLSGAPFSADTYKVLMDLFWKEEKKAGRAARHPLKD